MADWGQERVVYVTEKARRQAGYFALLERYGRPFSLREYARNVLGSEPVACPCEGSMGESDVRTHP